MAEIIDFLPSRYREQNVRRRSRIWLLSILGFFASVIAITSSIQLALHKQAKTQLAAVGFQYSSAQATQNMFNKLQANLASAQTSASLYASLDTDWPRTQILFAVVQPLTNEITISELTIAWETEQEGRSQTQARSRRRGTPEVELQTGLAAKRDLDTLRQQRANQRTIVRLSGTTTDNVALHRYVSRLSNDPLFVNAELLSFESSGGHDALSADFLVRIIVGESNSPPASKNAAFRADARTNVIGSRR